MFETRNVCRILVAEPLVKVRWDVRLILRKNLRRKVVRIVV